MGRLSPKLKAILSLTSHNRYVQKSVELVTAHGSSPQMAIGASTQPQITPSDQVPMLPECSTPQTTPQAPTSQLLALPLEIFRATTALLPSQDFFRVRLCCKDLNMKTHEHFAKTYFTKRKFMISRYSLETLLQITESDVFRPYLKDLEFGIESTTMASQWSFLQDYATNVPQTESQKRAWDQYCREERHLLHTGDAVTAIARAFKNLGHLLALRIEVWPSLNCPSFGLNSIARTLGLRLPGRAELGDENVELPKALKEDCRRHVVQVGTIVISALRQSDIEVVLLSSINSTSEDMFYTPLPVNVTEPGDLALSKLKALQVVIRCEGKPTSTVHHNLLADFLQRTPNLRGLHFNLKADKMRDDACCSYYLESLANTTSLPALRNLYVGTSQLGFKVQGPILADFVAKFPTLTRVVLSRLRLVKGSWHDTLCDITARRQSPLPFLLIRSLVQMEVNTPMHIFHVDRKRVADISRVHCELATAEYVSAKLSFRDLGWREEFKPAIVMRRFDDVDGH